jgi:hypothetical protein
MMMNDSKPSNEQRKHPRFITGDGYILLVNNTRYSGVIGNISKGGAFLKTVAPMMTEDCLFQNGLVTIKFPGAEVTVQCSILFIDTKHSLDTSGTGIAFVDVDEKSAALIASHIKIIQQLLNSSYKPTSFGFKKDLEKLF